MQNTSKRKAIAVGMIPVAAITIGMITAAAFADKNESATSTAVVAESTAVVAESTGAVAESTAVVADGNDIPEDSDFSDFSEEGGLIVEYNDGMTKYSVDGGETWSETVPDGVDVEVRYSEDGLCATIFNSSLLDAANFNEVQRSAVKMDESDKAVMFSDDDGLTWSELSSESYVYEVNEEEGCVSVRFTLTVDE
ncbi:MAG: glycoside hydrolase [Oscillospiraceae bacterium]|nr:glycoside hydrolase [Oscillospiraceae bacterium]